MVELGMLVLFDAADRRRFSLFFSEFSRFSHVFAIGCASSWGYFSSSLSLLFPFSFRMGKLVFEFRRAYCEFIPIDGEGWTVFSFPFGRVRCICVESVEFLLRERHRCQERTKRTLHKSTLISFRSIQPAGCKWWRNTERPWLSAKAEISTGDCWPSKTTKSWIWAR